MFKHVIWISVFLGWFAWPFLAMESPSFLSSIGIATAIADDDADRDKKKEASKKDERDDDKDHADDNKDDQHENDATADNDRDVDDSEHNNAANSGGETTAGVTPAPTPPAPTPPVDTTAPVVVPPANITREATGPLTGVVLGVATVTDNVDVGLMATPSSTGPFSLGVNTVTWRASDAAGNIGTATQTVTITDTTPPAISIQQPAITVEATASPTPASLGAVTARDLVNGAIVPANNAPATFPLGVTQVVWTATDAAGNTASATQNVVVQDTTPPVITAPAAATADSTIGQPITVAIGTATATDAFGPVSITSNAPTTFPLGATTVIWTATDVNGNAATATQLVTVNNVSTVAGLPPDPGPAGKLTLAGIDSDGDGVRDDVQRWIALTHPNSQKTRAALRLLSKDYSRFLFGFADSALSYDNFLLMQKSMACLRYVRSDYYDIRQNMRAIILNTTQRSRAFLQASRHLSGRMFKGLGVQNRKKGCNFNPDAMPN